MKPKKDEIVILKDIPRFFEYKISDHGEVWSFKRKNPSDLKVRLRKDKDSYFIINLWNGQKYKTRKIHQLVLESWEGIRRNIESIGRHNNGNKENNFIGNLYWETNSSNQIDSLRHQTYHSQKINEFQARIIKRLHQFKTLVHNDIAQFFGITRSMINSIECGLKWKHI